MYVQIVTFTLNGITEEQYHEACQAGAATFASLPGLLAKVWLRDAAANTYGGMYLWRDRESYDAYLSSDVFKSIVDDNALAGVNSVAYDSFDDLTVATQPGIALVGDAAHAGRVTSTSD